MKLSKFRTFILDSNTKQFCSYLILCIVTLLPFASALAQDGQNDATFNTGDVGFTNAGTGPSATVTASAIQSDGKVIIGGQFTSYNGLSKNRVARLNESGDIDAWGGSTLANSIVRHVSIQTDGKILVSGDFTSFSTLPEIGLVRLNSNGSVDTSFGTGAGANGGVYKAIPLSTGKIIIIGAFTSYDGVSRNRIARLNSNGSLDTTFDPGTGADATIQAVAIQSDGQIIIAGNFLNYAGTARSRIARVTTTGALDTSFDPGTGFNAEVRSIALQSTDKIIAGGTFTIFNGTTVNYITRLNTNGTRDATFASIGCNVSINTSIEDISMLSDDRFVIVGGFAEYNGVMRIRIARINSNGSLDTSFDPGSGANNVIFNISRYNNGKMFIGGAFTQYNSVGRPRVGRINEDGSYHDGGVGANNTIRNAKVQADGKVLVVGDFTGFDGRVANRIVRLLANGNTDASFTTGSGANFAVRDVAIQSDQKIIIVGDFATYNGVARSGIARLNSDGSLDTSFTPGTGANSGIYSIVIQSDGKILIGGVFTNYNGTAINRIARLNSDGTLDTSFVTGSGFDSVVRMLALQADGKVVVAGDFAFYNGQAKIAVARLNTNGTFDTSFAGSGTNLRITAAALQSDGKVLIGGDFTTVNGTAKNKLARLNSDGSVDNSFNTGTGPNLRVNTFAIEPDGQIIIGGDFNLVNGILRNYIARLSSDGSLDATFNPGTGANNPIYSLTPQADGVIIGGLFFSYNGVTRFRIAKISICQAPTITTVTPGSRCGNGTVTLNATASAGTLNWYSALTGGVSLGTGTSFVTPSISTTTTYFVDATDNSCTSGRTAVVATVGATSTITGSTPSSRCGTGTLTLSATASVGTLNWYAAASGGSSLGTGTNFITPSIANTTTYYVDVTDNGCPSARTAVVATVKTIPTITGTTPGTRCGAGTVSLGAATGGGTLNWYAGPTGGVSLGAGPTFNTPSIATTTSFFVDATNSGCTSARTPVVATINIPTISGTTPSGRCDVGTVTLGATTSAGTLNWYAASSGGASLGTGTSFITPSLSATTTYYVEATNTGCTSARTAVVATISAVPTITGTTPGTRCGTGTVTLSATGSAGTLNWYAASTGGAALGTGLSFTTPSITNTTTYFVDVTDGCTSARTAVVATVNSVPTITVTTPANRCGPGTITLGATTGAGTLNWYAASTGGTSLGTGTSFVTPSITTTTTYHVDVTNNGCTSARTGVIATINPIPTITSTTSNVRCDAGTVTIGATASAGTLNWFGLPTGGPSLGTGATFTTPVITSTTTYYVEVTNNGCTSPRTAIVANITPTPTITSTTPASRCGAGTVDLSAIASAGMLNWYTAATGGSSLASGTTFTTPTIANTTTYYVESVSNGCTSARSTVIATINPVPSITNTTPATVANCDSGTTTLNASADFGAINWYSVASGGTSLGTGANFITPTITSSTTYYAEASQNGCRSARVAVLATVNETPTITSTLGGSQCNSGSISLSATANGGIISWYADATGGTTLGTGTNFTTPTISVTTTYYVQAANNGCTSVRTAVAATINATPTIMATTPASRCGTGTVTLSASGSAGILNWFDVATGGTSLGSGNDFTTPSIATTTTFYVETSANSCASSRIAVVATINAVPSIATTTPASAATCDSGSVTLSATAAAGTISWFAAATGGNAIGTGNSFITPLLTTTTTYYVAVTNNGCTSTRTAVVATINATPPRPTISANNTNPVAPVLTSSSANGNQWFRDAVAISGATASTLVIQQAGVFTVRVTQQGCVSPFSSEYTYVITALEPMLVNELALYPNPAVEELVVGLGGFDRVVPIQISIMDIQGRDQHQTSSIGKTEVKIDIRHFTSGQYVLLVEQGKTKLTKRFIKK